MAIQLTCSNPECGRTVRAKEEHRGKKVKCPACGQVLTIPLEDDEPEPMEEERIPAPSGDMQGQMQYMRAYKFIFDKADWITNVIMCLLCQCIPAIGGIVMLGYSYELTEALHKRGDRNYPSLDFNRFSKYLIRGLYPFLIVTLLGTPAFVLLLIGWFVMTMIVSSLGSGTVHVILFLFFTVVTVAVIIVVQLAMIPMTLRAGLSQELAFGETIKFGRDFMGKMWKETILATLFLGITANIVIGIGLMACIVGAIPAGTMVILAQHHIVYQLYEVYLSRGGMLIPLKEE